MPNARTRLGPKHLRTPKVMAIAAVALATNTYLTIRATLTTATMAITMMVMMMAMTIFPYEVTMHNGDYAALPDQRPFRVLP